MEPMGNCKHKNDGTTKLTDWVGDLQLEPLPGYVEPGYYHNESISLSSITIIATIIL